MGSDIAVSVIIPVYNTGDFLTETLQCICGQTLRNIEIIVMDDGSTDNSPQIAADFVARDSRILLMSQKNQGQSVARANATRQACGKYIYYMDSDDIIDTDALASCYEKCEALQLDFVLFDGDILNPSNYKLSLDYQRSHLLNPDKVQSGVTLLEQLLDKHGYSPSPCLNFIRADYYRIGKIYWYPGIIHEDELFTSLLYLNAERVSVIPRSFYHRRLRDDSTMTRRYSWRNIQGYQTVTHELLTYRRTVDATHRRVVNRYLSIMMNAVVYCAWPLPFIQRLRLFFYVLFRFPYHISLKYYVTLFLKKYWSK